MNENHIDMIIYHNLSDNRDFYKGSFAANELDSEHLTVNIPEPTCFSFIANTLERNEKKRMGHWLGFFIQITRKKIHLKFVDSFKMPYIFYGKNIKNYITKFRYLAIKNGYQFIFEEVPFRLQASDSRSCGGYTIYAILELKNCKSNSLCRIFSRFDTRNRRINDRFVENFVIKKWPKTFCSNIFSRDNKVPFCPKKIFGTRGCLKLCRCSKNCCSGGRSIEYKRPHIKNVFS